VAAVSRRLAIPALLALALAAVPAASAQASLVGFQTESHKVGCYLSGQGARCDVRKPRWEAPPKPPSCELDWGQGVAVGRHGPADYVCAGDTTLDPGHQVLFSGDKVRRGRFKCKAKGRSTIKCVNTRNEHGFIVSRGSAEVF
jgi:hypothetical protein